MSPLSISTPSEMLLRSTLIRDSDERDKARTKTKRRPGKIRVYDPEDQEDYDWVYSAPCTPRRPQHVRASSSPTNLAKLTPHEQVLRARLEHVLDACRQQQSPPRPETPRSKKRTSTSSTGSGSNGQTSASGAFNWLWSSEDDERDEETLIPPQRSSTPALPAESKTGLAPATLTRKTQSSNDVPQLPSSPFSSAGSPAIPCAIPKYPLQSSSPPSPKFNARSASQTIKNVDGYVSFGSIEGLGMPDMDSDSDSEEPEEGKKWWLPWRT